LDSLWFSLHFAWSARVKLVKQMMQALSNGMATSEGKDVGTGEKRGGRTDATVVATTTIHLLLLLRPLANQTSS